MKPPEARSVLITLILACCVLLADGAYGTKDRVRLSEVQTLTAQRGHYTNARRGQPIPQMQCMGGSAGCKYEPSTMQCYNRGFDGRSVQWECKADLDDRVKFGSVHVSCEGFDYPGDDYVLAGSCGVEFTLEPTGRGQKTEWSGGNSYSSNEFRHRESQKTGSFFEGLLICVVIGVIIYAVYSVFFRGSLGENAWSTTGDDYPGDGRGDYRPSAPPPAGFRPDVGGNSFGSDDSCSGGRRRGASNPLGGFWGGAATGGMLGYMFGSRNQGYGGGNQGSSYYSAPPSAPYYSPQPEYRSSSSDDRGSTRSASGFGGTTVR